MARVLDSFQLPIKKNGTTAAETYINNPKAIAGQFSASTAYAAGDYVFYNKVLYRFTAAHAAGAWTGTDAVAATIGADVTHLKERLSEKTDLYGSGTNILILPDYEYNGDYYGVTISIKNNRIKLNGTTPASRPFRLKLTNGYDLKTTEDDAWVSEDISDLFVPGNQYCIAYKVYNGELPSTIGTPARIDKSSASFLSITVPKNIATVENMPHYIMLYVPQRTTVDVEFEPFFMKAYTANDMFNGTLSDMIKITNKQTPANEFNYFTVNINKSLNDGTVTNREVTCVVTFPDSYKAQGTPTPIIMYSHGRTDVVENGNWCENDTDKANLIRAFTGAGYAVFDVDATQHPTGGAVDVGCPELMQSYIKAYAYIKEHYNVEDRLNVYGYSFGTFAAMNMLCWYPGLIKTGCITAMRASLEAVYDRGAPFDAEIAANYGFGGNTFDPSAVKGHDPYGDIVTIDGTERLFESMPPVKIITSTGDTLELTQSHRLIDAWKQGGNVVKHTEVNGVSHHNLCYLTSTALRSEVINWFNRFM